MNNIYYKKLLKKVFSVSFAVSIAGVGGSIAPNPAYAFFCANCSTFYQQMFQYVQEVDTALNTAEQLQTQIQQYNNMVQQGVSLPSRMFNSVTTDLQRVVNIYNNAKSIGRNASNIDNQFRQQFPDYQSYLNKSGKASEVMPGRYDNWSKQGLDNARTAMSAAGMNTSTFANEDHMLDQVVERSQSAAGRMQAIQAGNEISAMNVQQLQKLRDLMATQINMQSNYIAQQQDRQSVSDAFQQKFQQLETHNTGRSKGF